MNYKDIREMYYDILYKLENGVLNEEDLICIYIIDNFSITTVNENIKKIEEVLYSNKI